MAAAAAGKSTAAVARAAGSKAKSRKSQQVIGLRLLARIRDRGQVRVIFDELGFDLRLFAAATIHDMTAATKIIPHWDRDGTWSPAVVPDNQTRLAAMAQYMTATGLAALPPEESGAPETDLLACISDADLADAIRAAAGQEAQA